MRGYVDRIDMMKKNGKQFIRVVDYKTGKKQFHISDILYGLNMQMLLYLSAIQKNGEKRYGEKIVPAGILYMPAEVSAVEADIKDSDDKVKTERDKKLKMNGIILDNRCVVEGMEKNIAAAQSFAHFCKLAVCFIKEHFKLIIRNKRAVAVFVILSRFYSFDRNVFSGNIFFHALYHASVI